MHSSGHPKPRTLGELKRIPDFDASGAPRSVKNEIRRNLLRAIEKGEALFPGVHGYEDTVVPQIVNALLSRHNSSFSACAARPKVAFSAVSSTCSIRKCPSSPVAKLTTIP